MFFILYSNQKYGELCTVEADAKGRIDFRVESTRLKVWDIIGRSLVIHYHGSGTDERYLLNYTGWNDYSEILSHVLKLPTIF